MGIQVERKASAHEDEEMEERGVASSKRVVLSIIVRMCEHPWEVGKGANNVDMEMGKTSFRDWDGKGGGGRNMVVDF